MKRFILTREKTKRGCCYCADAIIGKVRIGSKREKLFREVPKYCPHPECPYHELDYYQSFFAYLKKMEKMYGSAAKMLSGTFCRKE